jgi:hypothetical protein
MYPYRIEKGVNGLNVGSADPRCVHDFGIFQSQHCWRKNNLCIPVIMKKCLKYAVLTAGLLFFFCPSLWADDVLTTIDESVKQYKAGDLAGAASNLDYAAQLIRQKKSEVMKKLLPEPLSGWKAEPADAQALGTAVFGGGINVSRKYTRNSAVITIDIVSDSPVMQSLIMMLNNPMVAGVSGGKLKTINGQRTIIQYNESKREGEINIVVGNRFMVTVKGRGTDRDDMIAYAESVDFDALTKY